MLNLCQVPLNACGISTTNAAEAENSPVWGFVLARLQSMRVNSCTTQVKECLQSEDRCGPDYTQCIGLDTDAIIRLCPYDTLVGCQEVYADQDIRGDAVYEELYDMVQGIMLNIDNNMLTECQNAANEAMIKVCGDADNCENLTVDENLGARSLQYKICEYSTKDNKISYNDASCVADASVISDADYRENRPLAGILSGLIFWENVDVDENGNLYDVDTYLTTAGLTVSDSERQLIKTELGSLQNNINNAMGAIESDQRVHYCMKGRTVDGIRNIVDRSGTEGTETTGRFPHLTDQIRLTIANAALRTARENYYAEYDKRIDKMYEDFKTVGEKLQELSEEDQLNARREASRQACINLAHAATVAMSPVSTATAYSNSVSSTSLNQATLIMPYTSGKSNLQSAEQFNKALSAADLTGSSRSQNLTLIRDVTTTFNWDTLVCKKCIRTQTCAQVKKPCSAVNIAPNGMMPLKHVKMFSSEKSPIWGIFI